MELFSAGNLITIFIVAGILVVYRLTDKRGKTLDAAHNYGKQLKDRLKEELDAYITNKKADITDYGAVLTGNMASARAMLANITEKDSELKNRAENLDEIKKRLDAYDASLGELLKMTGRVEINLNRIQEESNFVENVVLNIDGAKKTFVELSRNTDAIREKIESGVSESLAGTKNIIDAFFAEQQRKMETITNAEKAEVEKIVAEQKFAVKKLVTEQQETVEQLISEQQRKVETITADEQAVVEQLIAEQQRKVETITADEQAVVEQLITEQQRKVEAVTTDEQAVVEQLISEQQRKVETLTANEQAAVEQLITEQQRKVEAITAGEKAFVEQLIAEQYETVDKQFAEQQARIDNAERERGANVERDKNIINTMLKDAVNNAGERAGKLEDEIYREFRTQTEERARTIKQNIDEQITALQDHLGDLEVSSEKINKLYDEVEQKSSLQTEKITVLESTFDEQTKKLETEFQMRLDTAADNVNKEIALYESEASAACTKTAAEYTASLNALKHEIAEIEKTNEKLKEDTFEKTAETLQLFEAEFTATMEKRSKSINSDFIRWREEINNKLGVITESQEAEYKKLEFNFTNNLNKHINKLDEDFQAGTRRLTESAEAFESNFATQVKLTEENINSLKEQIQNDWTELRDSSREKLDAEIARNTAENFDKITDFTREIEDKHKALKDLAETKNAEIATMLIESQNSVEENEKKTSALKTSIEETSAGLAKHCEELFSGAGEKAKELEENIRRQEEKIQEFFNQTKIIEKNIEMKNDLNRQVEDLQGSVNKLEIQKGEISAVERQLSALKKIESEVNIKVARFEGEQRRMELIEDDFNKLVATSIAVKEKLSSLTENNDTLQEMQLKIRNLSEIMAETDKKYERIEKKNNILDETSDSIDSNFKRLQDSEKTANQFTTTIAHLTRQIAEIQNAMTNITKENEQIVAAANKVASLDAFIKDIDGRIVKMQQARQWCADLEGRLKELNEQAHDQVRLAGNIIKKDISQTTMDKAPSLQQRKEIMTLKRTQNWTVEEIARTLKIPQSAVELTIEMSQDDIL
jgi:chromosome segregation ATPase